MKRRFLLIVIAICAVCLTLSAQSSDGGASMSPLIRRLCRQVRTELACDSAHQQTERMLLKAQSSPSILALVKADAEGEASLTEHSCRIVDRVGQILIVDIPLRQLPSLSLARGISRIEAERGRQMMLDTMATVNNVTPIYQAEALPQAYRGDGVVMGVMDVGFDLTHPNFFDDDLRATRIRRFWDQIATQQEGDTLYVGREFTTEADILAYQHSRDIDIIHHGTHTLGIAAGTGVGTRYVGMAPEADLCLVSNAVTDDLRYIPDSLEYRYTYATDVLGFKYIFDYATSVGRPCVISFSEGSSMDFAGYDMLFGEALEQLVGPGRILVASAGNSGWYLTALTKPEGTEQAGAYLHSTLHTLPLTLAARGNATLRFATHGDSPSTFDVHVSDVVESADTIVMLEFGNNQNLYQLTLESYPSCYDADVTVVDIVLSSATKFGVNEGLSVELLGADVESQLFCPSGAFETDESDPLYDDAVAAYNVNSPSSLPCVISVGATSWRTSWLDMSGTKHDNDYGTGGSRGPYSSMGPTLDGRVKPDVMAPGSNIISSGSYFYMQSSSYDPLYTVGETYLGDKTYPWVAMSGTSQSSPAVGGIIALWLQANPQLSPSDVLDIIAKTSRRIGTATEHSDNACGYGSIDAYAGMLMALGLDGITDMPQYQPQAVVITPYGSNSVRISMAKASDHVATVSIYSLNGQLIKQQQIEPGQTETIVEIPQRGRAVYAVSLRSADPDLMGSTLVRL